MAQPYLHEHVTCVDAPATWLSGPSGQLRGGADGLYVADRRAVARLELRLDGAEPVPLTVHRTGAASAVFTGVLPAETEPAVVVTRRRLAEPLGGTETVTVHNTSAEPLRTVLTVAATTDYAVLGAVRDGSAAETQVELTAAGPGRTAVRLDCEPAPDGPGLRWQVVVEPGGEWTAQLRFTRTDIPPIPRKRRFSTLRVTADDRRLDRLVRTGVQDLDALRRDGYYTAGSPWYLTLFGRDALWAARLALPLGTEVAAGTLRALAERQDPQGRVLHEVRPADATHDLPEVSYATVDATPLFVSTLAEAYRWGMPAAAVEALLPAMSRALDRLAADGDFVLDPTGGLQGWKDSTRVADGPVALCEVQAYAFQAAVDGAWLLESFGRPGAERWRDWAAGLAARFRAVFWRDGRPATAVGADGGRVETLTSNLGHLLGTGLLSADERARVAELLGALRTPFGLRTAEGGAFLSYHRGSVWPHDTVIVLLGLVRDGYPQEAAALVRALLDAGERFDFRLPELFGGDAGATPYPSACRPQAWAAAVGPALLTALLGLDVDVPGGRITFAPMTPSPVGAFRVRGLKVSDGELDVSVTSGGTVTVHNGPVGVSFAMADGTILREA